LKFAKEYAAKKEFDVDFTQNTHTHTHTHLFYISLITSLFLHYILSKG